MASVKEEFELLKAKILAGKGGETIHVVWQDQVRRQRRENPKKTTMVRFESYDPKTYSDFHEQKQRFIDIAGDPSIAMLLLVRALAQVSEDTLRQWLTDGHQTEGDEAGPPPPKAELPEWLL
jgi:hypothetical protein